MGFFDFLKGLFGRGKEAPRQREETFPLREQTFPPQKETFPRVEEFFPKPPKPPKPPKIPKGRTGGGDLEHINLSYHPPYTKGKRRIKGYLQAGGPIRDVTMDDIRALLETVSDRRFYTLIVHGAMINEYPGHDERTDIHAQYRVEKWTLWDEMEDNPKALPVEWINAVIGANEGREWEHIYTVSIVDE